ncbi:MAG: HAMP domain-containing histidine kinase [Lachnospiraceae bacterium]|nr:HAMP domain-containing histidine kinase [Lachnospiraceae bacterium]
MGSQTLRHYDGYAIGEMYRNGPDVYQLPQLSEVEVDADSLEDMNVSKFDGMMSYLKEDALAADYIYFDTDSFVDLFKQDGMKNTNCRFSDVFSEDAYFIFENNDLWNQRIEEVAQQTAEQATKEFTKEAVEDAMEGEGDEGEDETYFDTLVEENVDETGVYNITAFAVYDPDQDLFYSTWDQYFEPMGSYIYSTVDLLSFVAMEEEERGVEYGSLIIPLLHTYNNSFFEVMDEASFTYDALDHSNNQLDQYTDSGIRYYLETKESDIYANVTDLTDIENSEIYYTFTKIDNGNIEHGHSMQIAEMHEWKLIGDQMDTLSTGAVFAIGFDPLSDEVQHSYISNIGQHVVNYDWLADNIVYVMILTAVSFVLLMVQAISLIRTTGKKSKEDKEISLYFYDRWFTEIWLVSTGVIMCASFIVCTVMIKLMGERITIESMALFSCLAGLCFGFCFMELTLSFARRCKAHNWWKNSLIVRFVKFLWAVLVKKNHKETDGENVAQDTTVGEATTKKGQLNVLGEKLSQGWQVIKQQVYNIRGTTKLMILFDLYLVASIMLVIGAIDFQSGELFLGFILLQGMALVVVICCIKDINKLIDTLQEIRAGNLDSKVDINEKISVFRELGDGINHIGDGLKNAIETSLKDERMKTELITNVSHDLKTPLTSIINYVDLLKKEEMPNEDAKHYVEVLDAKSQRLKQLTEDLVEAAKATSGNIELEMMPITFDELMKQALGEFEDKFEKRNLTVVASYPEKPAVIEADGRRLYRIIENVLQNVYKYALEGTRVYVDLEKAEEKVIFTLKNISASPLNISPDELMERFTRGDSARTTEGSGLGLSIAKDLTRLQNGEFEIQLDGDLFKVIIRFPMYK